MATHTFETTKEQEDGLQYAADQFNVMPGPDGKAPTPVTADGYFQKLVARVLNDYYRQLRRKEILATKLTQSERDIVQV